MRKFLLCFLTILMAACFAVAATACSPASENEHSWSGWSAVGHEPTCTKDGFEIRMCSVCGTVEERPVDKLGHDWDYYYHNEDDTPKALDNDTHTRTCKREGCNQTETGSCTFIIELGAPCQGNYVKHTCAFCGYVDIYTQTEPVPHKYTGEWKYLGDWYSGWDGTPMGGAHSRECDYGCGNAISEPCEYDSVTVPADVENGGFTLYTCKVCKHSFTVPLHDHEWGDYVHNEDSTPDNPGDDTHTRTCKYLGCPEKITEHCTFITDIRPGQTTRTCKFCGYFHTVYHN